MNLFTSPQTRCQVSGNVYNVYMAILYIRIVSCRISKFIYIVPLTVETTYMYSFIHSFIHSFIYSGHFHSASSSPLLLRGAPCYITNTVSEFHAEAHRQLQAKDLPKVPTWRLERESNPRPSGSKSSSQPKP